MSTQGAGAVVLGPGIVLLVAGGVVVGTGILVGKGIMWCHDKLEENYHNACQSYTALKQEAEAEALAHAQDRQEALQAYIERYAAPDALTLASASADAATDAATDAMAQVDPAVARALEESRAALASTQRPQLDYQAEQERRQLANEIVACKGIVSPAALDEALAVYRAPESSALQLRAARVTLHSNAQSHAQQRHQEQLAAVTIADATRELRAAHALLAQSGQAADAQATNQLQAIGERITEAKRISSQNAGAALTAAEEALADARRQVYAATRAVTQRWSARQRIAATQQGQLDALNDVISDLALGKLATDEQIAGFQRELSGLREQVSQAQRGGGLGDDVGANEAASARTASALAALKQRLFALSDARQQRLIGDQIATTLTELGFSAVGEEGAQIEAQPLDTDLRIGARRAEQSGNAERQEHLVYFNVDAQGHVTFDFSGYEGAECVKEATRIFHALRRHGILLMDAARLAGIESEGATAELLARDDYAPPLDVNKALPIIQQAILDVLEQRMGFTHVEQHIAADFFEVDAHNGQGHRYHAEATATDEVAILRDGQDVTHDNEDPVAAAAHQAQRDWAAQHPQAAEETDEAELAKQGYTGQTWVNPTRQTQTQ